MDSSLHEVSTKRDISFQVMRFPRFSDVSWCFWGWETSSPVQLLCWSVVADFVGKTKSALLCKMSHFPYKAMTISPGVSSLCTLVIQTTDFTQTPINLIIYPTICGDKGRKHNFWEHYKAWSQNCHMSLFGILPLMIAYDAAVNLIMFSKSCFRPFSVATLGGAEI